MKLVPPPPGTRAALYVQLLCPDLHPIVAAPSSSAAPVPSAAPRWEARVGALEEEVAALRASLQRLAMKFGETID